MNKKKIWLYIAVILLVIIIGFLFIKIFNFNNEAKNNNKELPEVSNDLIQELYSYLDIYNPNGVMTMYSKIYTTKNNLNADVLEKVILNYIVNYDKSKLENLTIDELKQENIDGTPLYKIKTEVFNSSLIKLFGKDTKINLKDFTYQENIKAINTSNKEYFYIYQTNDNINNIYEIFKKMDRYLVTDNNKTIKIYDYYLKCNKETAICYNDERNSYINNNIKYSINLNLDDYVNYLTLYEHTFKYENGNYYWVSSNAVD